MYGEKAEEAEELRLDLEDVKSMYKTQIDELLRNRKWISDIKLRHLLEHRQKKYTRTIYSLTERECWVKPVFSSFFSIVV